MSKAILSENTTAEAVFASTPKAAVVPPKQEPGELVLCARKGWISVDWRELYEHRELLYFLMWRDVKVRYKQTVLGVAWAVLQPLFSTFVFTIIFGSFAKITMDSDAAHPNGFPYAIGVFCAQLPWMFFSTGVTLGGQSLINQHQLLTKIYLPRLLVPTGTVGVSLLDTGVSLALLIILLPMYHVMPSWQVIYLPLLLVLTLMITLGMSYLLSALTISYRDFRHLIPFLLQAWMYVSPVVYPLSLVPARYRTLYCLNPMVGIIDGFRSAILGKSWNLPALGVSAIGSVLIFLLGVYYFRKTERRFADVA